MDLRLRRQPEIIRPVSAIALAALAVIPARAAQLPNDDRGQGTPCVSCLVIGIDAAALESAPPLAPGSLEGVQILVTSSAEDERTVRLVAPAATAGARVAILISPPIGSRRMDEVV